MTVINPNQPPGSSRNPEIQQRYAVYSYTSAMPDGIAYTRSFIVVMNGYDVIVRFTRLQDYAGVYQKRTFIPISADPEAKLHYICAMLNFVLVEHGGEFGIRHVFGITREMLEAFFTSYALTPKADGTHKGQDTVERCVRAVTGFMANLSRSYGGFMKLSPDALYREESYFTRRGERKTRSVPNFRIRGIAEVRSSIRDLPTNVFELLIPLAFRYTPDIAFAMVLQAFAGLRAGEALNVRQVDSPLGPGLRFTEIDGRVTSVEIDLTKVYVLRSDGKSVGRIKKPRKQDVFYPFLDAFCTAYQYHLALLEKRPFEAAYAPMFPNEQGKATVYDSYLKRFKGLVKEHLTPLLLSSGDPKLRIYGQKLCENNLTPHSLRHWFTVQLVLRGMDIGEIQHWRGDSSPQSALEYLQNKGDLVRELQETDAKLTALLMKVGEELNG